MGRIINSSLPWFVLNRQPFDMRSAGLTDDESIGRYVGVMIEPSIVSHQNGAL